MSVYGAPSRLFNARGTSYPYFSKASTACERLKPMAVSCFTPSTSSGQVIVATYKHRSPDKPVYNTSGNVLMIGEYWGGIATGEFSVSFS